MGIKKPDEALPEVISARVCITFRRTSFRSGEDKASVPILDDQAEHMINHGLFWVAARLLTIDYSFSGLKATQILGSMTSWNHVQIPLLGSPMWFSGHPTIDYSYSNISPSHFR